MALIRVLVALADSNMFPPDTLGRFSRALSVSFSMSEKLTCSFLNTNGNTFSSTTRSDLKRCHFQFVGAPIFESFAGCLHNL